MTFLDMACLDKASLDKTYLESPPGIPGRRPRSRALTPSRAVRFCRLAEVAVAATFSVPLGELRAATRCRADAAFARQVTMYLAHTVLGMSHGAVGGLMRRERTTVAHACRVVEARRDDPATDRIIRMLECVCAEIALGLLTPPWGRR
jgi:hypothetical protein